MKTKKFSIPTKQAPQQALWRSKRFVFGLFTILVVLVNVQAWVNWKPAPTAINLDGTGISLDAAATINNLRGAGQSISPNITPQNADSFAGLPQDPLQRYPAPFPASHQKFRNK
jgi:hypothetical protein